MTRSHIDFYSQHAQQLAQEYNSLLCQTVHEPWLANLPANGFVLDVGCGSGRDARFFAENGLFVTAVEPSNLLDYAKSQHDHANITWLNDSLPDLFQVFKLQIKYDVILLSAVWMHIAPTHHSRIIRKLSNLLKPNGKIIITLKHGPARDGCPSYPVESGSLAKLASQFGLQFTLLSSKEDGHDSLGRSNVQWETVQLQLSDDGSGAFPLLRNIVVNDGKSSTYKIGLLRSLLRIAEGHPGAVLEQTSNYVVLPLGLVAFYWLKLYKPLVDKHQFRQTNDKNKGLGFVTETGWQQLKSFSADDFFIGAEFNDPDVAKALGRTLNAIAKNIRKMPATYITLPNTSKQVFEVETQTFNHRIERLTLNAACFASFGKFIVPKAIWQSLVQHSVWIEPALVNEWARLIQGYHKAEIDENQDGAPHEKNENNGAHESEKGSVETRKEKQNLATILSALQWQAPEHATAHVRKRAERLLKTQSLNCIWAKTRITQPSSLQIDHAFPFSRWPNNDLWNLLPSTKKSNSSKSDKLPSSFRLADAEFRILTWWQTAWEAEQATFFEQANLALPNLTLAKRSFNDVFEAMQLQRNRLRDMLQLQEW